jgi:hypothetical protein
MVATLDRPSGTDMSQIILEEQPRFTPESAHILDQFDTSIKNRILNVLEDRMRSEKRSQITTDDVWAAIKIVVEQLQAELTKEAGTQGK